MANAASIASPARAADERSEQHSTAQSVVLHLLPGALATIVYVLTVPLMTAWGYPTIAALYLPMILTVIVVELGYLYYVGRKRNGRLSLAGVVNYREPVPWWQYIVFPVLIVIWGILVTALVAPLDNLLLTQGFGWLPGWYRLENLLEVTRAVPRQALIVTAISALLLNGIIGPIVEELYFRGHLLPRISRFGRWAPLINVVLFSFYHFWSPWMFLSRVILLLPMVYLVWWKRNIYLGIITHCALNLIGTTVLFAQLLG